MPNATLQNDTPHWLQAVDQTHHWNDCRYSTNCFSCVSWIALGIISWSWERHVIFDNGTSNRRIGCHWCSLIFSICNQFQGRLNLFNLRPSNCRSILERWWHSDWLHEESNGQHRIREFVKTHEAHSRWWQIWKSSQQTSWSAFTPRFPCERGWFGGTQSCAHDQGVRRSTSMKLEQLDRKGTHFMLSRGFFLHSWRQECSSTILVVRSILLQGT